MKRRYRVQRGASASKPLDVPGAVSFSKNVETGSGWIFKPQVDLSAFPATGDVKAKSRSHVPGVGSQAELETQVVDNMTWQSSIGFDFKNNNLPFGVNYSLQPSEHRTDHMLFGAVSYEF